MHESAGRLEKSIVAQEKRLDSLYATQKISELQLRALVGEIAALQGELRVIHLDAHLEMKKILLPPQIAKYDELRGYGKGTSQQPIGNIEMEKINLVQKFSLFADYWRPKIVGELNDAYVKLAKLKGEFVWHHHENEDELFLVVKGRLLIKLRECDIWLEEGELVVIPKGVEHLPIAEDEVHLLLLEPKTTLNTGNVQNERTVAELERI